VANKEIAERLRTGLKLDTPAIGIAFVEAPPPGVAVSGTVVPSTCAFWREAEKGVFYAAADKHFNCPVGTFVMGFDMPKAVSDELMELVGTMTKCGYISGDEPGQIPTNKKKAKGVVYGPLEKLPVDPDAVIAWLTPAQAMIWSEALGGAEWGGDQPSTVFGRPACGAIPSAMGKGSSLSLGCAGMRTFTGVADDRMLGVISGAKLESAAQAVTQMRGVNDAMEGFYKDRAAKLTA